MLQFDSAFESCIFGVTKKGIFFGWDYRSDRLAAKMQLSTLALPSSLVVSQDCNTASIGHYSGKLCSIDLRTLKKPTKNFQMTRGSSILALANGQNQSVWVSAGNGDICEFQSDAGGPPKSYLLVSDFATSESHSAIKIPHLLPVEDQWALHAELEEIPRDVLMGDFAARSVKVLGTSGTVYSCHNDGVVRIWNESGTLLVPAMPSEHSATSVTNVGAVKVVASQPVSKEALSNCREAHNSQGVISDFCLSSLQFDMIVTAGRDGLIKIWK
jgi:WD40 repeat protein